MKSEENMPYVQSESQKDGFKEFISEIKTKHRPQTPPDYYYIKIWSLVCAACIHEIPFLKLLEQNVEKNIIFTCISSHSDNAISNFLFNNKIDKGNFVYINKMNKFIYEIFHELEFLNPIYPFHIIMNSEGDILSYYMGAFENFEKTEVMKNFINNLGK
jgi:hypothetical protein